MASKTLLSATELVLFTVLAPESRIGADIGDRLGLHPRKGNGTFCGMAVHEHPGLTAISFDLPSVVPVAERHLAAMGVGGRVDVVGRDFFADDLPRADVIVMGKILQVSRASGARLSASARS